MKPRMMTGITQPVPRRTASITRTISAMPKNWSQAVGEMLRSTKSSPCQTIEPMAEAPRHREQHEDQEEHDPHVDLAQPVGAHDAVGGIQVEGGGRHGNEG